MTGHEAPPFLLPQSPARLLPGRAVRFLPGRAVRFLPRLPKIKQRRKKRPALCKERGVRFFVGGHRLSMYSEAFVAAIAPSAMAVETCRTAFVRQSPATNTPGVRVLQLSSAMM